MPSAVEVAVAREGLGEELHEAPGFVVVLGILHQALGDEGGETDRLALAAQLEPVGDSYNFV